MNKEVMALSRNCLVCNSPQTKFLYRPPTSPGPIVQCSNCGFVYVNPIDNQKALIQEGPELFNRDINLLTSRDIKVITGSWEEPGINGYLKERNAKIKNAVDAINHINKHYPGKGRILDVGCYCGLFLSVARQKGWDCFGIEPLVMPSIYARGVFNLNVITDTLEENSFPEQYFDVITYYQVFEHLVNPYMELQKVKKLLKRGGLLIIEVPNIDTFLVSLLRTRHRHFVPDHVSFFSKETLKRFLENNDFRILEVYFPTRALSFRHLFSWKNIASKSKGILNLSVPAPLLDSEIRLNLHDIVTVIAQKC